METRPTLDKDYAVKPSRPGWIGFLVAAALVAGILGYVSMIKI